MKLQEVTPGRYLFTDEPPIYSENQQLPLKNDIQISEAGFHKALLNEGIGILSIHQMRQRGTQNIRQVDLPSFRIPMTKISTYILTQMFNNTNLPSLEKKDLAYLQDKKGIVLDVNSENLRETEMVNFEGHDTVLL